MVYRGVVAGLLAAELMMAGFGDMAWGQAPTTRPAWREVSVHDPAVLRAGKTWYVFGSHLAAAKSDDLIGWTLIDAGAHDGNRLIPNVKREMREAFAWGESETFWAPVTRQFPGGRFYHYYCVCKGDSPRSALGLAISDTPDGPYRNVGILLRSGMWGERSEDGAVYDPAVHPNAVDPDVFFDTAGSAWMVYGSYSGGVFILRLDKETGRIIPGQGYGKRLVGGQHARIEGPSVLYNPRTGYYYLLLSFGGLGTDGGYQVRVFRSRSPEGPYLDPNGRSALECHGSAGSFFEDKTIEPYGLKVVGNHRWNFPGLSGEPAGYISPGHCSAAWDEETGKCFLFFHTRFEKGRGHQVRVHQILWTESGWPLLAPHRYGGETQCAMSESDVIGAYECLDFGTDISPGQPKNGTATYEPPLTVRLTLAGDGTARLGDTVGTWRQTSPTELELTLGERKYTALLLPQWNPYLDRPVVTFTALSDKGTAMWASRMPTGP